MITEIASRQPTGYRFGIFEVQIADERLLRRGQTVRMQKSPFLILVALLENPGKVILREELKERLWSDQIFVNFDHGLDVAVAKLRETLGETASKSKLIKTVPGKGYQFIGLVEPLFTQAADQVGFLQRSKEMTPPGALQAQMPQYIRPHAIGIRHRLAMAATVFCLCSVGALLLIPSFRRHALVSSDAAILVESFVNSTGNSQLDGILSAPFRLKLQESPYLHILASPRPTLSELSKSNKQREMAACREVGATIWVGGELRMRGNKYEIAIDYNRCSDGRQLGSRLGYADSESNILPVLGNAVESIRHDMGEPVDLKGRFNVSLTEATTNSPAALKALSLGDQMRDEGNNAEAIANYKLAVTLDPKFALAYGRLGSVYANLDDQSLSNQFYTKAYELRERSTDRERLYISAHYFGQVTGEVDQSIATYRLWRDLYPYDDAADTNLAVFYLNIGRPDRAAEFAKKALSLNSSNMYAQGNLAQAYLELHDDKDLSSLCQNPLFWTKATGVHHGACFWLSFEQGDEAHMAGELQWAKGKNEEPVFLDHQAWVLFYRGQLDDARHLLTVAMQMAENDHNTGLAASIELDAAILNAAFGASPLAKSSATKAIAMDTGSTTRSVVAVALAQTGDISTAQSESREAVQQSPLNTILNSSVLASVRAVVDLHRGDPRAAIQELEPARPYELNLTSPFATIYYRGLADEADDQPQKASAEFEKVVQNEAVAFDNPYIQLSEVEQVHSLEASGDLDTAKRVAQKLFLRWKDADPDFPLLLRLRGYVKTLK